MKDWKPPKRLSIEEVMKLNSTELNAYFDSWKRPIKSSVERPKPNYKEMSYEEALKQNYGYAHFAVHRAEASTHKTFLEWVAKDRPENEEFYFFWSNESPFSQWYKTEFTAPIYLARRPLWFRQKELYDNVLISFSSAEQMMMYYKSVMFGDVDVSNKILNTHNVRKIKELGRQVANFESQIWDCFKHHVVSYATHCKFRNNPELLKILVDTYPKTIVEASPYDKVWGIGLSEDDERAQHRSTWEGENLLGEILTNFRNKYIKSNGELPEYPL